MVIKYIVKSVSIIDSNMTQWILTMSKSQGENQELKDDASKLVSFFELKPAVSSDTI